MKILCIESKHVIYKDIMDVLSKLEINFSEIKIDENKIGGMLESIKGEIEHAGCDFVFSLDYSPAISLICKLMGKKYISWIVKSYEANIYSCTILNDCNYIFIPDYSLWEEFHNNGINTVYYLPFAAHIDRLDSILNNVKIEYQWDLSMQQNTIKREELKNHPFEVQENPLKDSTRGYLEGCIACQYQVRNLDSMSYKLPTYVKEDLEKWYPVMLTEDSVETADHFYDHSYFNDIITASDRELTYSSIIETKYFEKNLLCNDYPWNSEKEFIIEKRADYWKEVPKIVKESKINLVITNRNWKTAIPQLAWDIMGSGGFLLTDNQEDYNLLFQDIKPILGFNSTDFISKAIYFLNHDSEREQIAGELSDYTREYHSLRSRIMEIFSVVSNK